MSDDRHRTCERAKCTLYDDIDFMSILIRARFEERCGDLFRNTLGGCPEFQDRQGQHL
ncbi:hypothetical protein M405DRAFT_805945 [Rhizopogon salebrosus TDB-379]|nr:hypothetical protein M405DRAFT_805945 [Rhizopogon salebrosus TDB-379]